VITVLFACVHNAGRSQIAAALFNNYADPAKARAISAGTQPADRVHPEVVQVMAAEGIDLSRQRPQLLTAALAQQATWLITMGCGDECPVVPGTHRDDWPIADPKGQPATAVAGIVDEIRGRVERLVDEGGWR
jgi:arsenate reductase